MERITLVETHLFSNHGDNCESAARFHYTGEHNARHDSRPFDVASDIETFKISVKSDGFTLASGLTGETVAAQLTDFNKRVHSVTFIYVSRDFVGYVMDLREFNRFVTEWCYISNESAKNGGGLKVRAKHESAKMVRWLEKATH